ncbi:solute carrier family 22 member 3 [Scaptodrosophila lebanonensis]|uniref:Solute carrier family 22 member 3 n=1 Tax=Drosophila lebanonensis TaxID=7225 RepID=A0A6J2T8L4_DROLE|nr:solute carrier family 22 member 3 [Scaptodrosophila lebanonensis]XP_030373246.1 solute carrier family 22 member 3 [Scaptodrosophila lebanonensis]XP_030373253.1 solute carrier family 22 member 3 [Scaptodrosophila lebanonensis]
MAPTVTAAEAPPPTVSTVAAEPQPPPTVTASDQDEFTLDAILKRIGQFGRFQLVIFLLICLPMMFHAMFSVTYVFTAATVVHRCNITECDNSASQYIEPWTEYTIPLNGKELDKCNRIANKQMSQGNESYELNICVVENYEDQPTESCPNNNFIFRDEEVTISNDFGIFCNEEWKLSLVGTINNLGQFFGIPIGGFVADRYGRTFSIALGGTLGALLGVIRSFSPSYIWFIIFEFLDNLTSSTLYSTCFIIGIELVGPKYRVWACSLITIFYAVGEVALAMFAKAFQDWRALLRVTYMPSLILLAYFWILPESVRWLLSQGKESQATDILRRAARVNGRKLSESALDKLVVCNREKLQQSQESKFPIKEAFSNFKWRIANCSFCWIVHVLVYYGLSLNVVLLDGDKYNNFAYIALVEIPGFLVPLLVMDRFGRRYSLSGLMILSGLCCIATIFVNGDNYIWQLILFLVSKLTITASFQVLYFFASEIFPTNLRNSLLSFCSMMGRFGSMLAPQTPLLAKYYPNAPLILFAGGAIISGCLTLFFPETTNIVLPTTVKEADAIGVKKKPPKSNDIAI